MQPRCSLFISLSHWCYSHLKDNPNWVFEVRGPVNFKNVSKPVMCYWLIENVERSMQEDPTLEDPSEVALFAELISDPRTRQDSLIADQDDYDMYVDPLLKGDIERLGRPRYDSMVSNPHMYSPNSPLASRHISHDALMSSMHSLQVRGFDERPARSYSVSGMSHLKLPPKSHWAEPIQEEEPQQYRSISEGGVYLSPPVAVHKISTGSNSSVDSELTMTLHKTSSTASNASEQSGEGDSGCDPHEPETVLVTQQQRRTGLDAVTIPESWVKQTREKFERITSERKKKEAEMETFEYTKSLRSRSMSHSHSSAGSLRTHSHQPLRLSTSVGTQVT